jgi:hypothetical protein
MPILERTEERRRTPRVPVAGSRLEIPTASNVQVLDISRGGVLLSSPRRVEPGDRAGLQVKLGEEAARLEVEVCRASPEEPTGPGPFRLGARILPLDEASAAAVRRFLEEPQS